GREIHQRLGSVFRAAVGEAVRVVGVEAPRIDRRFDFVAALRELSVAGFHPRPLDRRTRSDYADAASRRQNLRLFYGPGHLRTPLAPDRRRTASLYTNIRRTL